MNQKPRTWISVVWAIWLACMPVILLILLHAASLCQRMASMTFDGYWNVLRVGIYSLIGIFAAVTAGIGKKYLHSRLVWIGSLVGLLLVVWFFLDWVLILWGIDVSVVIGGIALYTLTSNAVVTLLLGIYVVLLVRMIATMRDRRRTASKKCMKKIPLLLIIDMQNDFIDGALGTAEAVQIVPRVAEKVRQAAEAGTELWFTQDTHTADYANTQEGRNLPVPHCVEGTPGWEICTALQPYINPARCVKKGAFGASELANLFKDRQDIASIELCGLCTDICVISNAMLLKAFLPEVSISVDAACCAGVTPDSHQTALDAMKMCQIQITNE